MPNFLYGCGSILRRLPVLLVVVLIITGAAKAQTLTVTHQGNFEAGSIGSYKISIATTGNVDINSDVLLTEALPPELTLLGIDAGGDWSCVSNSCYHKAGGVAGFTPLVVTVAVTQALTASKDVENVVKASLVGKQMTSEISSADKTHITLPLQPIPPSTEPEVLNVCSNSKGSDPKLGTCDCKRKVALEKGYQVLQYTADSGITRWFSGANGKSAQIGLSPFLPAISTGKNQIMVEVCGLKFETGVNISMASIGVPEKAVDIRGTTPTTTLSSAALITDAIQAAGAETITAIAATIPSNVTPPGILANSILTQGVLKQSTSASSFTMVYTPMSVSATAADFARAILAYQAEAKATRESLRTICFRKDQDCAEFEPNGSDHSLERPFGTVWDTSLRSVELHSRIRSLASTTDSSSNQGQFDKALAFAGRYAQVLSALNARVTASNFGTRIASLASNYNTLYSDIFSLQSERDLLYPRVDQSVCKKDITAGLLPAPDPEVSNESNVKNRQNTSQAKTDNAQKATALEAEYCYLDNFLTQIKALNICVQQSSITTVDPGGDCNHGVPLVRPSELYNELSRLRNNLQLINQNTNDAFAELNRWYEDSNVEYIDTIQPSTTNTQLRIGINATETYVPLVLGVPSGSFGTGNNPSSGSGGTGGSGGAGTASGQSAVTSSATTGHYESSTTIRIERVVHYNLVGGVMVIHVPNYGYTYAQSTVSTPLPSTLFTPCPQSGSVTTASSYGNSGAPTYFCPVQSSQTKYQIAGMAGINWIPWGRDYYPHPFRFRKDTKGMFGILFATSVTSLGSAFGGLDIEPANGFNFFAGVASAHTLSVPSGTGPVTASSAPAFVPTNSTFSYGFTYGVGFDLSVFKQIFTSTSAPGIP